MVFQIPGKKRANNNESLYFLIIFHIHNNHTAHLQGPTTFSFPLLSQGEKKTLKLNRFSPQTGRQPLAPLESFRLKVFRQILSEASPVDRGPLPQLNGLNG